MDKFEMIRIALAHKWALLTFAGAVVVAFSAFKASIDQKKSEEKATKLAEELQVKTEEVQRYQALTIQLQEEAIDELKHQTGMLTGGDSYPLLVFNQHHEKPYLSTPEIWVSGKYPIFNFSMQVFVRNGPKVGKQYKFKFEEIRQLSPVILSNLVFDLREEPNLDLCIRFFARNGYWEQFVKFRISGDGKYQRETKLVAPHKSKTPFLHNEFGDDSFPVGQLSDLKSFEFYKK